MLAYTAMHWFPAGTSKHYNTNKLCPNHSNLSLSIQRCLYDWEIGLISLWHLLQLSQNSHCINYLVAFSPVPSLSVSRHCTIAWKKACWTTRSWQQDAKKGFRFLSYWKEGKNFERHQSQRPHWQHLVTPRGAHNIFLSLCGAPLPNPANSTSDRYWTTATASASLRGPGMVECYFPQNPFATHSHCRVPPSEIPNTRECLATSASCCSSKTILGIS